MWDFAESNIFSVVHPRIGWLKSSGLQRLSSDCPQMRHDGSGKAYQADASTTIHATDGPIIVTDPPYYDNIDYADLSDFLLRVAASPAP